MNDLLAFSAAFVAGAALGCVFFAGLWWTIQRALTSHRPARCHFASKLLRIGLVLVGFYIVSFEDWRRLLICLLGFCIARYLVTRMTRFDAGSPDATD